MGKRRIPRKKRKSSKYFEYYCQKHSSSSIEGKAKQTATSENDQEPEVAIKNTYFRVFITNIPFQSTAEQLVHFLELLLYDNVRILKDNYPLVHCRLMTKKGGGGRNGCGTVLFSRKTYVDICENLSSQDKLIFRGRKLRVQKDKYKFEVVSTDMSSPAYGSINDIQLKLGNFYSATDQYVPQFALPQVRIEYSTCRPREFELIFVIKQQREQQSQMYKINISFRRIHDYWFERDPSSNELMIMLELLNPPLLEKSMNFNSQTGSISGSVNALGGLEWPCHQFSLFGKWKRVADEITANDVNIFGRCKYYCLSFPANNQSHGLGWFYKFTMHTAYERPFSGHKGEAILSHLFAKDCSEKFLASLKLPFTLHYCLECLISCTKLDPIGFFLGKSDSDNHNGNEFVQFMHALLTLPQEQAERLLIFWTQDPTISYLAKPYTYYQSLVNCGMLEDMLEGIAVVVPAAAVTNYKRNKLNDDDENATKNVIHTLRVNVTPLRVIAKPPEPDLSNRVLRQFAEFAHRFVRVNFVDEYSSMLNVATSKDIVELRVKKIMFEGFVLADRRYTFLAYSNSQLRGHSCWFYDEGVGHPLDPNRDTMSFFPSKANIRQAIGDLSSITTISKLGSRLGQGFSSSLTSFMLKTWEVIPDVERNGYCFSDGVGTMSFAVAKKVQNLLNLKHYPSAIQIRFGGCKGVLSLKHNANVQQKEEGEGELRIQVRNSMLKFSSQHQGLEILSVAKPMPCYLNRQLIAILTALGIADTILEKLCQDMLSLLKASLQDDKQAIQLIRYHRHSMDCIYHSFSPMTVSHELEDEEDEEDDNGVELSEEAVEIAFHSMQITTIDPSTNLITLPLDYIKRFPDLFSMLLYCLEHGKFSLSTEPFLQSLYYQLCGKLLLDLQTKTRIFVPKGICLIGVLDVYNVLEEDEVFVQFYDQVAGERKCLKDVCVTVGRNPSLHPGDIRVLTARYVPQLEEYLCDVIVFSAKGNRPKPNEMSGGDLDGDIYFVIYDEQLVPCQSRLQPPMSYSTMIKKPATSAAVEEVLLSDDSNSNDQGESLDEVMNMINLLFKKISSEQILSQ